MIAAFLYIFMEAPDILSYLLRELIELATAKSRAIYWGLTKQAGQGAPAWCGSLRDGI